MLPLGSISQTPHRENVPFSLRAIFWVPPSGAHEGVNIQPSKIAHSIEDSIGTIEAQIGCGVVCVRLTSRTQEIAQSENGTFSRCGVFEG